MIPDLSTATWRKSSYSEGGDNDCVEVADGIKRGKGGTFG